MVNVAACPKQEDLQQFLLGRTSGPEAEGLERHLEACDRCLETLRSLMANDTLADAARSQATGGGATEGDAVPGLIDRLRKLRPAPAVLSEAVSTASDLPPESGSAENADPDLYDFLAPPREPGELGWLGAYRVLKVLGSGGMGVVYLAEDPGLHRRVALKAMKPALAASPSARQRFLREARAAAAVKHDHVVTIYQVDQDRDVPFLAMELLEGETLEERLHRDGRLAVPEVLRIGREVAEGLAAAHARGLIHRDVKPSNIWLEVRAEPRASARGDASPLANARGSAYRVKLLDFGLARAAGDEAHLTQRGAIVGTPAYMAPEQARGEPVDPRCDLFSLGCVLYRACTGRAPFQGKDTMSVLLSLATDHPRPPRELNPEVPPALNNLILRLIAKGPADRPSSAEAVVKAITAIERDGAASAARTVALPAEPRPSPPTEPTETLRRPRPLPQARASTSRRWLAVAALLLLVLGVTVYRVVTNQGELVVEVDDPAVEVKIVQNGVLVQDKTSKREFTLTTGKGEIEVLEKDGIKLMTKQFELTRGDKTTVKVTLQELADARKPPTDPDRRAAEWVLSIGGTISIKEDGKEREIKSGGDLPRQGFELTAVKLNSNPKVSDAGLAHFKDCKNLTHLGLAGSQVSDVGLAHFKECKSLIHLYLQNTRITDAGLAHFEDCKNLRVLRLDGTQVSDVGLAHFKDCKNLGFLRLDGTQVSDVGLAHFKDCKNLTSLYLSDTQVSAAGVAELQKALPKCKIEWDGKKDP